MILNPPSTDSLLVSIIFWMESKYGYRMPPSEGSGSQLRIHDKVIGKDRLVSNRR